MKKFEVTIEQNGEQDVLKVESSTIMGALERAHKVMQIEHGATHTSYKIVKAAHVYSASGRAGMDDLIRSDYPIPGGPNPDMWEITGKTRPVDLTNSKN